MEALASMEIPAVGDLAAMARSLPVTYGDLFNLCHMIVSVLSVRKDAGKQFGISNPVAAWASSIITVFAGSLVANPLLGKAILAALSDERQILMAMAVFLVVFYCPGDLGLGLITIQPVYATVCTLIENTAVAIRIWCSSLRAAKIGKPILAALSDERQILMATAVFLVVFYCPGDLGFGLITIPPVYASVCTLKEVQRALKVSKGIKEGLAFNPNSVLAAVLIGTIKGNGSGFCTPFTRAIRGVWSGNELLKPSVATKLCLLLAIGLYGVADTATSDIIYLTAIGLFISVKLSVIFGEAVDPLAPLEKIISNLLSAISGSNTGSQSADDKKND